MWRFRGVAYLGTALVSAETLDVGSLLARAQPARMIAESLLAPH
jgi:hypothetical protein